VLSLVSAPDRKLTSTIVRANAFHLAAQSGRVRLVHFGNRSESFEHSGGPTELLMKSSALDEIQQLKIKEALCYLAPEQTGQSPDGVNIEDHRTVRRSWLYASCRMKKSESMPGPLRTRSVLLESTRGERRTSV
jgi:hypothetical protein